MLQQQQQEANLGRRIGERQVGHENETKPCIGDDSDGDARESHFSTFSRATTKRILSLGICREFSARDFVSGSTRSRLTSFPAFSLRALVQETRSNFCFTIAQAFEIATRGLNIVASFHQKRLYLSRRRSFRGIHFVCFNYFNFASVYLGFFDVIWSCIWRWVLYRALFNKR